MSTPRIQFLCFHHLFEEEIGPFEKFLSYFFKSHTFPGYTGAIDQLETNQVDRPSLVLSFDDGFKNSLTAAEMMSDREISGCFFICPSTLKLDDPAAAHQFCKCRLKVPAMELMDREDIQRLVSLGHEIGFHSYSHPRLADLEEEECKFELNQGLEALKNIAGEVKHFAWPFGSWGDINDNGIETARQVGFKSIASAERGCHFPETFDSKKTIIRRDFVDAIWPISHIEYFMYRNIRSALS